MRKEIQELGSKTAGEGKYGTRVLANGQDLNCCWGN